MDSPGRGACTGDPKLVFGGHQGLENAQFRGPGAGETLELRYSFLIAVFLIARWGGVYRERERERDVCLLPARVKPRL